MLLAPDGSQGAIDDLGFEGKIHRFGRRCLEFGLAESPQNHLPGGDVNRVGFRIGGWYCAKDAEKESATVSRNLDGNFMGNPLSSWEEE
jgi:hypothetical protein